MLAGLGRSPVSVLSQKPLLEFSPAADGSTPLGLRMLLRYDDEF